MRKNSLSSSPQLGLSISPLQKELSMDSLEAFTPSPPCSAGPRSHPQDGWMSLIMEDECPVTSKCVIARGETVAEHLRDVHHSKTHIVPTMEDGVGVIEIEAAVWMRPETTRRSAVLLNFDGALFAWTLESRSRADGETQASVVVQLLEPPAHSQTPSTTPGLSPGLMSSFENAEEELASFEQSRKPRAESPSPLPKYQISLSVGKGQANAMEWTVVVDLAHEKVATQRHDRLVSWKRGLILLWPTHREVFLPLQEPSASCDDERQTRDVAVLTTIQRL